MRSLRDASHHLRRKRLIRYHREYITPALDPLENAAQCGNAMLGSVSDPTLFHVALNPTYGAKHPFNIYF